MVRTEEKIKRFNYNLRTTLEGHFDRQKATFINDLKGEYMRVGITVISSYKATIKQRIDMNCISSGSLIRRTGRFLLLSGQKIKKGEEREERRRTY